MQPVVLYTINGGFVVSGEVPPFQRGKEADVLLWGGRVFRLGRRRNLDAITNADGALIYIEAFAIALVVTNG